MSRNIKCSPAHLAEDLASKALLFKSIVERELKCELVEYNEQLKTDGLNESNLLNDIKNGESDDFWNPFPLLKLYFTFHTRLMSLEKSSADEDRRDGLSKFSDVYAQTIACGLFASRWMSKDDSVSFKRENIKELLPSTSDFLKQIFVQLIEVDSSQQVAFCIDELFSTLYQVNVKSIFEREDRDPVIHFYEEFLSVYDQSQRKDKGVYYTPDAIVDFIVRSIDEQLKEEFGLPLGLASTKTWDEVLEYLNQGKEEDSKVKLPDLAKGTDIFVRILDPATGTGTFIKRVLEQIRTNLKEHWKSIGWSNEKMQAEWTAYVSGKQGSLQDYTGQSLLSRLNAFELMMTPYTITHLRMGLFLQEDEELSFEFGETDRLNVFLTNALEHPDDRQRPCSTHIEDVFLDETTNADVIKCDTAITVVLGNPPYNGISSNNTTWITNQIEQYKYVDGIHFNERKHWLNDDYVKFIRYGQYFIERSELGIVGYINPHSYLNGPTFRGMRWDLLSTYGTLYVLDLHGNKNKKEQAPNGSVDENVFNILQGVSINIFTTIDKESNALGKVYHYDLYGEKEGKYRFLKDNIIQDINWVLIKPSQPHYLFEDIDMSDLDESIYMQGINITDLFQVFTTGVQTSRDKFALSFSASEAIDKITEFCSKNISTETIRSKYFSQTSTKYPPGDTRDWKLSEKRSNASCEELQNSIRGFTFRPFDNRKIIFHEDIIAWPRKEVSRHLFKDNYSLITARSNKKGVDHFFISKDPSDVKCGERTTGSIFCPLYRYSNTKHIVRISNLREDIVHKISSDLQLEFISGYHNGQNKRDKSHFISLDILDYIYAVVYSPNYRIKYQTFLQLDHPRIPYPKDVDTFQRLVARGKELRHIHLLESEVFNSLSSKLRNKDGSVATTGKEITQTLPNGKGKKEAEKVDGWNGQIWINKSQYFEGVSKLAWNFYIGGYQPAQKWLKARKGRSLTTDEVIHYSKILKALEETDRIMNEIDLIDFL